MTIGLLILALASMTPDEAALRRTFSREIRSRDAAKRVEAVNALRGCEEEKTVALLVKALKDREASVRKAAAESLAASKDGGGKAVTPLCALLTQKKEDPAVRYACAQALAKASYRAEPLAALVETISGIDKTERHLFKFGADCTAILNGVGGQDFGAGKDTPKKWQEWLKKNLPAIRKEDAEKRSAYRKSLRKR